MRTNHNSQPGITARSRFSPPVYISAMMLFLMVFLLSFQPIQAADTPSFDVTDVIKDTSVTIYTYNFPANKSFTVLMGEVGTEGIGGIDAGTSDSGSGGSYEDTFSIPAELKGEPAIAIRLESTDGYFSYNWFTNEDISSVTATTLPANQADDNGSVPSLDVVDVKVDETVTIQTHNFPPNQTFIVTMGDIGSKGVGGVVVTQTSSGAGGEFSETYTIPDEMKGEELIAIRLESEQDYYAYNWFVNQPVTSDAQVGAQPVENGSMPVFNIVAVVENESVAIQTHDFPLYQTFVIKMSSIKTSGTGGIEVATTYIKDQSDIELTYPIPNELIGSDQIAIWMVSDAGYYSYNWFYNKTFPVMQESTTTEITREPTTPYPGNQTFNIVEVVKFQSVTIRTNNFPANKDFVVTMAEYGNEDQSGVQIGTFNSDQGGTLEETFLIPAVLKGEDKISIRLDSADGIYSYNWFYNR